MAVKQAIFRADASAEIGGGHVMRCLALAEALEATGGWACRFATRPATGAMIPSMGASIELTGAPEDEPAALAGGCDLLVVDHHGRDAAFERACRPQARRIMAIDDLADRRHDCDILLDQTAGRRAADYAGLVPPSCRLLMGSSHALLRPQFRAARAGALERRGHGGPVRRILVSLGASDPEDATSRVLDGIAASGVEAAIDVVLGAGAPHLAAVRERLAGLPQAAVLHHAVSNMAALMADADMAIGAAGTTSWERCCLGLPSLTVITADNQRDVAAALEDAGAARLVGAADIADAVATLAGDADARAAMAISAAGLCDGRGLDRVVLALGAPRDGQSPWLRLAEPDDGQVMFDWQGRPETRRFALNPAPPTRPEHDRWLARMIADAAVLLMLIMDGDAPAGVLRIDGAREVSIHIAPERQGRGLAGAALKLVASIYPGWTFHARVLAGNQASHTLFQSAGYRRESETRYVRSP